MVPGKPVVMMVWLASLSFPFTVLHLSVFLFSPCTEFFSKNGLVLEPHRRLIYECLLQVRWLTFFLHVFLLFVFDLNQNTLKPSFARLLHWYAVTTSVMSHKYLQWLTREVVIYHSSWHQYGAHQPRAHYPLCRYFLFIQVLYEKNK